jgi:hypothetical protein
MVAVRPTCRADTGLPALFDSFGEITREWTIDDVIADGDRVAVRATNRCVQDSFFGIPRPASSWSSRRPSSSRPGTASSSGPAHAADLRGCCRRPP